jgi:hypothetical protein
MENAMRGKLSFPTVLLGALFPYVTAAALTAQAQQATATDTPTTSAPAKKAAKKPGQKRKPDLCRRMGPTCFTVRSTGKCECR